MPHASWGKRLLSLLEGAVLGILVGLLTIICSVFDDHEWEVDPETEDYEKKKSR